MEGGFLAYLKQKKGPFPLWVWAIITTLVLYLIYRWMKNRGGISSAQNTAPISSQSTPTDLGSPGSAGDSSSGNPLTTVGASDPGLIAGDGSSISDGIIPPLDPTPPDTGPPPDPTAPPVAVAPTITLAPQSSLNWGGQNFKTKAAFNSWLKVRGQSAIGWMTLHPAGAITYLSLPAGVAAKTGAPKAKAGSVVQKLKPPTTTKKKQTANIFKATTPTKTPTKVVERTTVTTNQSSLPASPSKGTSSPSSKSMPQAPAPVQPQTRTPAAPAPKPIPTKPAVKLPVLGGRGHIT
jgi:hypothetical protein